MKTAVIRIQRSAATGLRDMADRFSSAWHSGRGDGALIQFESPRALFKVLSPKRWELVERLQALGPISIRGLARDLERDVKRVHDDVLLLIEHGLVTRTDERKVQVPYDVIRADFDLRAVA
ncbi:MAG: transcriptional regulator [Proteobacteria bacterium]|nr:transcriptional regulator [Pseudomonadota bacterium]